MRALLTTLFLCLFLTNIAPAAEVRLSVALSMSDAAKELIATYQKQLAEVSLLPNFASSGALAKQISQGAPTDIFISANPKWMNYLVKEGRISAKNVRTFAHNSLVFVGQKEKRFAVNKLEDLVTLERVAIGSPKSTPVGQYAEQALKAAGIYAQLATKLVMAKDVRQALVYADRGEADGAIVYKTDALLAQQAVILLEVPQSLYDEVTYPVGLTIEGAAKPEALAFFEFLQTKEASEVLTKYGFVVR